jgi:hypothetical protein
MHEALGSNPRMAKEREGERGREGGKKGKGAFPRKTGRRFSVATFIFGLLASCLKEPDVTSLGHTGWLGWGCTYTGRSANIGRGEVFLGTHRGHLLPVLRGR